MSRKQCVFLMKKDMKNIQNYIAKKGRKVYNVRVAKSA